MRCQQLLSLGQVIDKPEEQCQGDKPGKEEGCNTQDCVYSDTPEIKANLDQDYMQTDPYLKVEKLPKRKTGYQQDCMSAGSKAEGWRASHSVCRNHRQSALPGEAV